MTTTFDYLGYLFYLAKDNPEFRELVLTIYDYAIEEINKLNPKMLHWGSWVEKENGITFYIRLYGRETAELHQKASFLSGAHSILDHFVNENIPKKVGSLRTYKKRNPYHLKCFHRYLVLIISKAKHWFCDDDRIYGLRDMRKPMRDKYPKVFKVLKPLLLQKIPKEDTWNKKKIEKW